MNDERQKKIKAIEKRDVAVLFYADILNVGAVYPPNPLIMGFCLLTF